MVFQDDCRMIRYPSCSKGRELLFIINISSSYLNVFQSDIFLCLNISDLILIYALKTFPYDQLDAKISAPICLEISFRSSILISYKIC